MVKLGWNISANLGFLEDNLKNLFWFFILGFAC